LAVRLRRMIDVRNGGVKRRAPRHLTPGTFPEREGELPCRYRLGKGLLAFERCPVPLSYPLP
jgi:hypothetical protein